MGSTDKAVITGFICRLCSKMNRFVIHIYGEEGERMKLAEKINTYLPITVISTCRPVSDDLPGTALSISPGAELDRSPPLAFCIDLFPEAMQMSIKRKKKDPKSI